MDLPCDYVNIYNPLSFSSNARYAEWFKHFLCPHPERHICRNVNHGSVGWLQDAPTIVPKSSGLICISHRRVHAHQNQKGGQVLSQKRAKIEINKSLLAYLSYLCDVRSICISYTLTTLHTWCPLPPVLWLASSFGLSHLLSLSFTNATHTHTLLSAVLQPKCRKRLCMTARPCGGQCMESLHRSTDGQVPKDRQEATLQHVRLCTQCGGSGQICAT